ncbi:MAG: hypothetical protein MH321_12155 [Leptospiraceae bacterium]|nr:hypothetical protein [Leptospiraceae bacterium]
MSGYSQAKEYWIKRKYNPSLELFLKVMDEKKESIVNFFQKQNFKYDSAKAFIQSKLFTDHVNLFLNYNQNHWMVDNYLKYSKEFQSSTIQFLLEKYPSVFYEILKKTDINYKDKNFNFLQLYSREKNIYQLIQILREIRYLQELREEIEVETYNNIDPILKTLSCERLLLLLFTLQTKWTLELMIEGGNENIQAEIFVFFKNNMGRILERKESLDKKSNTIKTSKRIVKKTKFQDWCNSKFAIQYSEILNNPIELQKAKEIMESIGKLYSIEEIISKYKNENYSIDFSDDALPVFSITNKEELVQWIKNGEKYRYQYLYYIGFTKYLDPTTAYIENLPISEARGQKYSFHVDRNYIEQNLFVPDIEFNNQKINLFSMLYFLHYLKYVSNEHFVSKINNLLLDKDLKKENSLDLLRVPFIVSSIQNQNSNGMAFSIWEKKEFINRIKGFILKKNLEINIDELETIADLLSFDLNETKDLNGFSAYPFFRFENHYLINHLQLTSYELGRSIVEIVKRKVLEDNGNDYPIQFENLIKKLFQHFDIPVIQGLKIQEEDLVTDIDVVALQDNELLVIEAKYTYIRDTPLENSSHRINQLYKAGEQLRKLEFYLNSENGKNSILKQFHDRKECLNTSQIKKIHYYIVTPTFEDDYKLVMNKYRKISYFELEMIVNDNKAIMMGEEIEIPENLKQDLNLTTFLKIGIVGLQKKMEKLIKSPEELMKKYRIRNGKKPKISDIVDTIENDIIWHHLDEKFEKIEFKESIFETKTKKFLVKI